MTNAICVICASRTSPRTKRLDWRSRFAPTAYEPVVDLALSLRDLGYAETARFAHVSCFTQARDRAIRAANRQSTDSPFSSLATLLERTSS